MDEKTTGLKLNIQSASAVKAVLAVLLVLSAALTFFGFRGKGIADASGFSSESSFYYAYQLSSDTGAVWKNQMEPALNTLGENENAQIREIRDVLLEGAADEDMAEDMIRLMEAWFLSFR